MIVCERHNFEFHPNFSFSFLETPKIRTFLIFKVESHVCSCYWRHQIKIFDWTQFEYRLYEIASQQESNLTTFQSHSHIFIYIFFLSSTFNKKESSRFWDFLMSNYFLIFLVQVSLPQLNFNMFIFFNLFFLFDWGKTLLLSIGIVTTTTNK